MREIQVSMKNFEYPEEKETQIFFTNEAIPKICLELILLKEQLIDNFLLVDASNKIKVKMRIAKLGGSRKKGIRAEILKFEGEVRINITPNELDYWAHFFLSYYRDGIGAVDHIDVETSCLTSDGKHYSLVLAVPSSKPPLSPEEALKKLNL